MQNYKKIPVITGVFLLLLVVICGFLEFVVYATRKSAVFYGIFLDNLNISGYTVFAFRVNKESKKTQKTAPFADL